MTAGVGIKIPSGREIDGKYLDENVKEIEKWKKEWDECGVTSCVIRGRGLCVTRSLISWCIAVAPCIS